MRDYRLVRNYDDAAGEDEEKKSKPARKKEKEPGPPIGSIVKTGIIVGGVALIGWGCYKLIQTFKGSSGMTPEQLALYTTMANELFDEVDEYNTFWDSLYDKNVTAFDQEHLDFMEANIAAKEKAMEDIGGQSWLDKLNQDLRNFARTIGLWYILPTLLTAGSCFAFYRLMRAKKWPLWRKQKPPQPPANGGNLPPSNGSGPTPIVDPYDNSVWPTEQAWKDYVFNTRPLTTDPAKINAAKMQYEQMSGTTRAMISAQMSSLNLVAPPPGINWLQVSGYVLQGIAMSAMIVATCGAATPLAIGGGLATGNALAQAEVVLAQATSRALAGALI